MHKIKGFPCRGIRLLVALLVCVPGSESWAVGSSGCLEAEVLAARGSSYEPQDPMGVGYCLGMVQGMRDMAMLDHVFLGQGAVCVPEEKRTIVLVDEFNRSGLVDGEFTLQEALVGFLIREYPCNGE